MMCRKWSHSSHQPIYVNSGPHRIVRTILCVDVYNLLGNNNLCLGFDSIHMSTSKSHTHTHTHRAFTRTRKYDVCGFTDCRSCELKMHGTALALPCTFGMNSVIFSLSEVVFGSPVYRVLCSACIYTAPSNEGRLYALSLSLCMTIRTCSIWSTYLCAFFRFFFVWTIYIYTNAVNSHTRVNVCALREWCFVVCVCQLECLVFCWFPWILVKSTFCTVVIEYLFYPHYSWP